MLLVSDSVFLGFRIYYLAFGVFLALLSIVHGRLVA